MDITITLPLDDPYRMREVAAELLEVAERLGLSQSALAAARSHCAEQAWPGADIGPPDTVTEAPTPTNEPLNAAEAFAPSDTYVAPGFEVTNSAPPPPPPPIPAPDAEVDKAGTPWTAGVHAGNKAKKMDGTWKARRGGGGTKAPTNRADGGPAIDEVTLPTFQAAMAKLITAGVDSVTITTAVSQTVFGDMGRTTGGIEHVLAAGDAKLTGKAFNALKAIAVQTGNGSAI